MELKERKKLANVDVLKVIAIYSVILIHNFYANRNFLLEKNVQTILAFVIRLFIEGVPLFVAVNGYLIINKNFDIKKHFYKCLKIFLLIIIWSLILIILTALINNETISFKFIISNILLTNISSKYSGILWYMQDLLTLYLLFPILKTLHDEKKEIYNYLFILVMITTIGFNFINISTKLFCSFLGMKELPSMVSKFLSAYVPFNKIYFILYFMLGGYLFEYKKKIQEKFTNKILFITIIGNLLISIFIPYLISINTNKLVSGNFNYSTVFLFSHIIILFIISEKYKIENQILKKINSSIASNSLGIYFVHIIVTRILAKYIKFKSIGLSLLYSVMILFISWIITILLRKIPYIKKLVEM